MQIGAEFVFVGVISGFILAILLIVVFLLLWLANEKYSGTPCAYALGAFVAFNFGIIFTQGAYLPPHTPVCAVLGWFLLVMSVIQAMFEVTRKNEVNTKPE